MEKSIEDIQQEIVADFALFDDWADKYEYIIEMGKTLPEMAEKFKTEENRIHGCQSRVWLHARQENGLLHYDADSDAFITKGIVGLLVRVLSGHKPQEILEADLHFIRDIGLQEHLSPTRANGLASMVKQMKTYALAYH
jgi:cysteine desulfuration protein SufE